MRLIWPSALLAAAALGVLWKRRGTRVDGDDWEAAYVRAGVEPIMLRQVYDSRTVRKELP